MVTKVLGVDRVIEGIVSRLGEVEKAYLIDDYAEGKNSSIIDLVLIGNIDQYHLNDLSRKTEQYLNRKIRTIVLSRKEFINWLPQLNSRPHFLIWDAISRKQ